jgi:hypothetical protein
MAQKQNEPELQAGILRHDFENALEHCQNPRRRVFLLSAGPKLCLIVLLLFLCSQQSGRL